MTQRTALLAIDQGTTSTRAIVFDREGRKLGTHQRELPQSFPKNAAGLAGESGQLALVEHNAERIWQDTVTCIRGALADAGLDARQIAAAGITNQRETTVIWDRRTGVPIAPAIVWQDRRTAAFCGEQGTPERNAWLQARTGLRLDPYFSATKIAWLLDHLTDARARAEAGELAFGTIDSWLLWKLTDGRVHATDATNASRTLLYNLHEARWDEALLAFFKVPAALLPEVRDSASDFGETAAALFGAPLKIAAILGDQQAATVGQACFKPGMLKSTYGTGCFVVLNTGDTAPASKHKLLGTLGYRLHGHSTHALEGSIFVAGAAVQWLRDAVHLIGSAAETEKLAQSIDDTGGVYLVPAFTGLGAPYWDPQARGAILGLTRDSGIAHIVRAALESVCYQTRDLLDAMRADAPETPLTELRVDGGMAVNDWAMQFLADVLRIPVVRPTTVETTALGAALFAGLQVGVYADLDEIAALWRADARFEPVMDAAHAERLYAGWQAAVSRTLSAAIPAET
jgi:glycerol kinase